MEMLRAYIPMDRRHAMAKGEQLPDRANGAALFADISGFTPLTEVLERELGSQRGAEELTYHLNRVFNSLIAEVHHFGGSVIGFSGDAITCWFDKGKQESAQRSTLQALACGMAMQQGITSHASTSITPATTVTLAIKVAVASGQVRRFLVGDPAIQRIDVLAGEILDTLSAAEHLAQRGEVVLAARPDGELPVKGVTLDGWREDQSNGTRVASIVSLDEPVEPDPWPDLPPGLLSEEQVRPWLLPDVYARLKQGEGQFTADLRPAAVLFLAFSGIDYDQDEDAGILLDAYIRRVQTTIAKVEGVLLQLTMGDKGSYLCSAFGAPIAHDDDAVRAVAAALDLQAGLSSLGFITGLRFGISHGQMYTGFYGADSRRTYGVMGDKANLAARLMEEAKAGEILCDDEVFRLARSRWSFETLPAVRVKGKAGLIRVYRTTGGPAETGGEEESKLVGRSSEMARLDAALEDLKQGKGRVIFIEGEAGIGKSRLVSELVRRLRATGLTGLLGAGQSIEQQTPYRAWRDIFASYFALEGIDDPAGWPDRVHSVVQEVAPKMLQRLPLINDVLNLRLPDTLLTSALDPALRQESLSNLLVSLLQAWTRERPMVLVLEDAHWLDTLSWNLVVQVARTLLVAGEPLLMVVVNRPLDEFTPGALAAATLHSLKGSETLSLAGLAREDLVALVESRLGLPAGFLPPAVAALTNARADGNPFFAEEFVYALRDRGLIWIEMMEGQVQCRTSPNLSREGSILPSTLQGLILSRIDRLSPDQQFILKVAAVIGRTFAYSPLYATLSRFSPSVAPSLPAYMQDLMQRDFTLLDAPEPDLTYIFKHIITQEVAYQTLLFSQRKEIHRMVAEWYEGFAGGDQGKPVDKASALSAYLPLLAYHYQQAEDPQKELEYTRLAGEQSAARYANDEAIAYLSRAMELTPAEDKARRFELLLARERVFSLQGKRQEQLQDLNTLEPLADALGDPQQAEVRLLVARYLLDTNNYQDSASASQGAIELARRLEEARLEADGEAHLGRALWKQADYSSARQHLQRALSLSRQAGLEQIEGDSLMNLGIIEDLSGDRALARDYFEQHLKLRQKTGDRYYEGMAYNNLGVISWREGNLTEAQSDFERSLQIDREVGARSSEMMPLANLAIILGDLGDLERGREYALQALEIARSVGDRYAQSRILGILSNAHMNLGQFSQALDAALEALHLDRQTGDRQDETHRLDSLGYLFLRLGDLDQAQNYYLDALNLGLEIGDRDVQKFAYSGLCLIYAYRGDGALAVQHGEKGLAISLEVDSPVDQSTTWLFLGRARLYLGQLFEAEQAFHQAVNLLGDSPKALPLLEARAGLAQVALARNELSAASEQVQTILAAVPSGVLMGGDDPFGTALICYRVLQAEGNPRAGEILRAAVSKLREWADSLEPEARRRFLENVPSHRELLQPE